MSFVRKHAVFLAKLLVATLLIALLVSQVQQNDAFSRLIDGEKNWFLLAAGLGTTGVAVVFSFVRWLLVARAGGIGLTLGEALRFGALGFALTFVGPGSVGGDVFKAIAVARERKGQRAAAVTTVFVDRVMGLLALLVTASMAILLFCFVGAAPTGAAWGICLSTLSVTAVGVLGTAVLFIPGLATDRLADRLSGLPAVGKPASKLMHAWKDYRQQPGLLTGAMAVSFLVDLFLVLSFYLIALGLPFTAPSFVEHFFIVPINLIASAIPITPGGVGVREGATELMYRGFGVPEGQGTLIAAGHSLAMLATGGFAVLYYFVERSSGTVLAVDAAAELEPAE